MPATPSRPLLPASKPLTLTEAAKRLGISVKALRLYEERGLVAPPRSAAGWRCYGQAEIARAADVAELRGLGLSLAEVARVLVGDPDLLGAALAAHEARLVGEIRQLGGKVARLRALRDRLAVGDAPARGDLADVMRRDKASETAVEIAFDLPWPWGGERFELRDLRPVTYIVGPLFSGKTRLARRIAECVPGAAFLGLERLDDAAPSLSARAERDLAWLVDEGAEPSPALTALVAALAEESWRVLAIDMVEAGLERASQEAVSAFLRHGRSDPRPLMAMTRSTAILDLADVGSREAILLCPANHGPPCLVAPCPGAPGYEAVATCLAEPEVRARSEGVIAQFREGQRDAGDLRSR